MMHAEFVSAYGAGRIKVEIDPKNAARYLSARLLLPFVMMPVIGIGIALVLIGWIWTGIVLMATGIIAPRLIKRSASRFVLTRALEDERVYQEVTRLAILRITPTS
jgi:hypothetical protein